MTTTVALEVLNSDGTHTPVTSTTPLPVTGSTGVAQGSTTSTQTGELIQGAVTTASPTYVTATTNPVSLDVHGSARILQMDSSGTPIGDNLTVSGTVTSATTIFSQDVSNYIQYSVQYTDVGGGNTILFEGSNDNTTWATIPTASMGTVATGAPNTSGISALGIYRGNISTRYFRARVSTYVSGNAAVTVTFKKSADALPVTFVNGISGNAAHSAASSGNPIRVAGRVNTAVDTTLVAGDTSDLFMSNGGQLITKDYSSSSLDWQYAAAASGISNTTTAVTIAAAAGASIRNYITSISIATDTLGAATEFAIRDGASGTVIWRTKLNTTALPVMNIVFPTPLKGTANTLLEVVTLTASVTGAVYFNAQGYTGF